MDNTHIDNHLQLLMRIEALKAEKDIRENELKINFNELISGLNLVSILKGTTKNENPLDFIKSGVNTVLDLIIGLALGKNRSIKGFLSAVLVEKFTTMLIDNNLTNI